MDTSTFSDYSLEDKMNDYLLLWASQCLEIRKLDKLRVQANDLDVQIATKNRKMHAYPDKKQSIRTIQTTMETIHRMETNHDFIDVDYFKNLNACLNKKVETGRDCAWDEMANTAPIENLDEISEELKQMKELTDGLPDLTGDHLKELSTELEQLQEKNQHFNNLLKETAVAERKVKNVLFSWHLLNQGLEDSSDISSKKGIASSISFSEEMN